MRSSAVRVVTKDFSNRETHLTWVIIGSFFGFVILAFLLLYPVYRFLKNEAAKNKDEEL